MRLAIEWKGGELRIVDLDRDDWTRDIAVMQYTGGDSEEVAGKIVRRFNGEESNQ